MSDFQLNHLNIPARDPENLVRWYAQTFGLKADGHKVRGPGVLIAFQPGEPVKRAPELHLGFQVPDNKRLADWAKKFGATINQGEEFNAFKTFDPEETCLGLDWDKNS